MKSFIFQALLVIVMMTALCTYGIFWGGQGIWWGPRFVFEIQSVEADEGDCAVVYGKLKYGPMKTGDAASVRCSDGEVEVWVENIDDRLVCQDPVTRKFPTVLRLHGISADRLTGGERVAGKHE